MISKQQKLVLIFVIRILRHQKKCPFVIHFLKNILVYDDGIVKGLIHIEENEIVELYVDYFFQSQGIGAALIEYAKEKYPVTFLWALEKNVNAIRFYEKHDFHVTKQKKYEEGTTEYLVMLEGI